MLEDRAIRNKIRHTIIKAEKDEIITKDEVAFIIDILEKGRKEIERKATKVEMLKGELEQIKETRDLLTGSGKEASGAERLSRVFGNKFNVELDKKSTEFNLMRGQVAQLKANEEAIVGVIEDLIKAKERDIARRETAEKLREARELQKEREKEFKEKVFKEKMKEQEDTVAPKEDGKKDK